MSEIIYETAANCKGFLKVARMKVDLKKAPKDRTVIIGAGMAGLSAAISLASKGEDVILFEARDYPGGKMRELPSRIGGIDSGPTVFTMKYVFETLFSDAGLDFDETIKLQKVSTLARHAWDQRGSFDLHASRGRTAEAIGDFFDRENAEGYLRFCKDAKEIFDTLKDTFIGAQRPNPIELGSRVGLLNVKSLFKLHPFSTLMQRLETYFTDARLRQLFGRYATYVGSSPYKAPATLMLIAHVEQEGVWLIEGGMHALAAKMQAVAQDLGTDIRKGRGVASIMMDGDRACGVITAEGDLVAAKRVLYCGDVSALDDTFLPTRRKRPKPVNPAERSLSAITWSMEAHANDYPLHRHSVLFSNDYQAEFNAIFQHGKVPENPTVYICAQDRGDDTSTGDKTSERLLCLVNAPAFGDHKRLSESELEQCQNNMLKTLNRCGLNLEPISQTITQPADFHQLFPGSGGALYGRASHGWMASFQRQGASTSIPGLYLAGGSVHPGAGVPMATLSGMLAAEQIIKDRVLT